ncbi:MAG: hypothetical protein L3K24_12480, partial [Gammaproteobacteria bacterium]|nr:hypothetical protein [Gammaproteobacteria bacterium]
MTNVKTTLMAAGFALSALALSMENALAIDLDDLDVTIQVIDSDDIKDISNVLSLPDFSNNRKPGEMKSEGHEVDRPDDDHEGHGNNKIDHDDDRDDADDDRDDADDDRDDADDDRDDADDDRDDADDDRDDA